MKYASCILLSLFLIGIYYLSGKNLHELRIESGSPVTDVLQCAGAECCVSADMGSRSECCKRSLFYDETAAHKIGDVIFSGISNIRNIAPSKLLKLKVNTIIYQLLSSLDSSRFSYRDYRQLSFNTNSIRYSYGYYIYTLAHILI